MNCPPVRRSTGDPFIWPVRVYYEDTDAAGVVFYANYLKFMERARTEWLRSLGFEQTTLMHDHKVVFVVRSLAIEYLRPALFNDALDVTVSLINTRGSLLEVAQIVRRGAQSLVTAAVTVFFNDAPSFEIYTLPLHPLA